MTTLRRADFLDRAFIVSGWSSSQRMTRDIPLVQMHRWADIWHGVIADVMDRPGVECIVAEGSVRQGFIAFERPDYVLYIYVAKPFRGRQIARRLFGAAGIDPWSRFRYACRTIGSWQCRHKIPLATYDPMAIRFAPKDITDERDQQR